MKRLISMVLVTLLLSASASSALGAQPYGDVGDIVDLQGIPADQAETELANRGYKRVINGVPVSYWWNESTKTCAEILMTGGSVTEIESATLSSCGR